ncbi:MAG: hypothetical protein CMP23_07035 [Rickettsiales bacterium]|nr:hypothetical protein [Rickettsiales bacterium]
MNVSSKLLSTALDQVLNQTRQLNQAPEQDTSVLSRETLLFPLDELELLTIEGRDRRRFLHAMLSGEVAALTAGAGVWATFNNIKGRTIADIRLLDIDPDPKQGSMLALLETGASEPLIESLDRFIIAEKVFFERPDGLCLWLLAGATADETLRDLGLEVPEQAPLAHCPISRDGLEARVVRMDRSHSEARDLLLIVPQQQEELMLSLLSEIPRGSSELLAAARIEAGPPRFGIDFTHGNIPLEANLADRAINFNKGCYPGQEVICRINSMGAPARRLMRLQVTAERPPEPGTVLFHGKREVGYITSAIRSAQCQPIAALGYVRKKLCEAGTMFHVGEVGAAAEAQVLESA